MGRGALFGGMAAAFALVLLVLVAARLLLPACGLSPFASTGLDRCPEPHDLAGMARLTDLADERRRLETRIADLRRNIALTECAPIPRASCLPPPVDETLVLADLSASMGWDYVAPSGISDQIARLERRLGRGSLFDQIALQGQLAALYARVDTAREPDRIDVAKQALRPLAAGLPEGGRLRLMSFAECGARVRQDGVYSAGEAEAYERAVGRLALRSNTALAQAIDQLPGLTEAGREPGRPVGIVILSDGEDNCGGDPCAAAARLSRALPHAHVSVVSLAYDEGVNACIAEATGGRFYRAGDVEELMLRLRQTAGQLSEEECVALEGAGPDGLAEEDP